jgi:hypothetical protein
MIHANFTTCPASFKEQKFLMHSTRVNWVFHLLYLYEDPKFKPKFRNNATSNSLNSGYHREPFANYDATSSYAPKNLPSISPNIRQRTAAMSAHPIAPFSPPNPLPPNGLPNPDANNTSD